MKKLLTLTLIILLSLGTTFAYTQKELDSKKSTYKTVIKSKIWSKLENISEEKLQKILVLVDGLVVKYESSPTLSDAKKLQKIAVLLAFKDIVNEKLENEFSDINSILDTVNEKIEIIIISDKRCGAICWTDELIHQLKLIPSLGGANITEYDFSNDFAKTMLNDTGIKKLPAAFFSDNSTKELTQFLQPTWSKKYYSLELGSTFNPYEERSDRGFRIVDSEDKNEALKNSHFTGAKNWKIVWIEYTDVNCHYCRKMKTDGTAQTVLTKYPNDVKKSSVNFIWVWWKATQNAAEVLECIAKVWGSDAYNSVLWQSLTTGKSDVEDLYNFAEEILVDRTKISSCYTNGETKAIVASKFAAGQNIFWITGTPGNVILNIETGEYEIVSWAYPSSYFVEVIDRLLK